MTLARGSQAVDGTGSIADNRASCHTSCGSHLSQTWGISRRDRDDNLFGTTHGGEDVSRLQDILSTSIILFDVSGLSLLEDGDRIPAGDKLPILNLDCMVGLAMGKFILEHVHTGTCRLRN